MLGRNEKSVEITERRAVDRSEVVDGGNAAGKDLLESGRWCGHDERVNVVRVQTGPDRLSVASQNLALSGRRRQICGQEPRHESHRAHNRKVLIDERRPKAIWNNRRAPKVGSDTNRTSPGSTRVRMASASASETRPTARIP